MINLTRPHRGPVTQVYGNTQPDGLPHAGQDYGYTNGSQVFPEVFAAADGVVLFAGDSRALGWPNEFYINPDFNRNDNVDESAGNLVVIGHSQNGINFVTGYGHLEQVWVRGGQTVRAGNQIGVTGNTGYSFGKHLHFFLMFKPYNYSTRTFGCADPNPYMGSMAAAGSISLASTGTTHTDSQEDFMGGMIDASQAEDIAQRAAALVVEALNGRVLINPVQAESIVQATTERTVEGVDARNQGKQIDRQQADDIARAAAQYNQEKDAALYNKKDEGK
jgi:murein DD-endopeptidase MepM/ murein hydrolase activator NlpD